MAKSRQFRPCAFAPYNHLDHLPRGVVVHDVSSYADHPYCTLSPMWVHGGIPVPGMQGVTSDSVEGIWQGLKVIRGKTAPHLFEGPGRKRGGGKPSGHQFGNKLLGIVEARRKIYCVAYEWVLANRIDPALLEQFVARAFEGVSQFFHDTGDNGDINNTNEPLAHASVLVQYLNRLCAARIDLPPAGPRRART
ncbi:MAG TPA: hypothetical protein VKD72_11690 [Gemmataceae bacterium]|nr:hypothetical protein [Gemmataceae bacterium]